MQSQTELDEAIRLYEVCSYKPEATWPYLRASKQQHVNLFQVHKEAELTVHVFPGLPPAPGQLCHGEDRSDQLAIQLTLIGGILKLNANCLGPYIEGGPEDGGRCTRLTDTSSR